MIINQSPTIFVEKAEVIKQKEFKKKQYILTLKAPEASQTALPGEFAFIDCGEQVFLRRPLSYLRSNTKINGLSFCIKL